MQGVICVVSPLVVPHNHLDPVFRFVMFSAIGKGSKTSAKAVSSKSTSTVVTISGKRKPSQEVAGPFMAVPIDSVLLPEVKGESQGDRWRRFGHNNTALIVQCVQESTRETYTVGWRRWIAFNNWFGTDPWLRAPPVSWDPTAGGTPLKFKDFVAVSFMQQLCNAELLCPGTVGVYMSAVRYHFRVANRDITFFESPSISAARTALTLIYRRDNPVAGKKALPFTCDMVLFARNNAFNTGSVLDDVIVVCKEFMTVCMARVSEAIPGKPGVNHWLREDDVCFGLFDGRIVSSGYVHHYGWNLIRSVIIRIRNAKNDIEGEGHRFEYFTAPIGDDRAFDIVQDMYNWAVRAQLKPGAPYFSYRSEWTLSYAVLSKAIKKVASCMGLDPARYRPHSLRIGGASMLAAAAVPDYVIQKQGRWKSLAFLEYIRLGKQSFDMALSAMVNPKLLTSGDVGRWHAGADRREGGA